MGIRAAWKEDLQATPAEMVYGEPIRLPGQFLNEADSETDTSEGFVKDLKKAMKSLQPRVRRHGQKATFVFKDLATTQQVFLRHDAPTKTLQPPYDGPYKVLNRGEKTFKILINGRAINVSIDRLKPAYILEPEGTEQNQSTTEQTPKVSNEKRTRSGRISRPPVRFQGL
ncbi:uncharacterized protein LOC120359577 [Solenopsis invicta]|uniref:uncharacterized protein LOC120359577 n=1 Tax=Solenopsis invicta TaxID=13686 RepID=UPI00193E8789|nr:uncharacterized protein LOC120359577 [Solenopsis invicta]